MDELTNYLYETSCPVFYPEILRDDVELQKLTADSTRRGLDFVYKSIQVHGKDLPDSKLPKEISNMKRGGIYEKDLLSTSEALTNSLSDYKSNNDVYSSLLTEYGLLMRIHGNYNEARSVFDQSITLSRNNYDPRNLSITLGHYVDLELAQYKLNIDEGLIKSALSSAIEGYTIAQQLGADNLYWFLHKLYEVHHGYNGITNRIPLYLEAVFLNKDMFYNYPTTIKYQYKRVLTKAEKYIGRAKNG